MLRIFDAGAVGDNREGLDAASKRRSGARVWAPLAAGLGAAVLVAWIRCPAPPLRLLSWERLVAAAVGYNAAVCLASAMGVLVAYAILGSWAEAAVPGITFETMLASVWFGPLSILLAERSPWALAASMVLAASVTLLISRRAVSGFGQPEAPEEFCSDAFFHLMPEPRLMERMLAPLCASVSVQTGVIAAATGHPVPAAALCGAGTAVITWRRRTSGWQEHPAAQGGRARRNALVIGLSTILTIGGLMPYLAFDAGFGGSGASAGHGLADATAAALRSIFASKRKREAASGGLENAGVKLGSIYPGIILLPETQPYTTIVPPLPALRSGASLVQGVNPLSIPFFGAYWLFKAPDTSPPPSSIHARGRPDEHRFTSTDHAPLFMEAHQDFGTLLNLKCCRAIEVAVRNADRYPGTVALELILTNSRLPGRPTQSLGTAALQSTLSRRTGDDGRAVTEILTFPIPSALAIREFDEATVRFQLTGMRADTAARTAIERFLFVPK